MASSTDVTIDHITHDKAMDSVSKIAIRNINPNHIDISDPEQRKLVEHLKRLEANIWEYSDNQPSFLASLNRNDPGKQRKFIESMMGTNKSVTFDDQLMGSTETMSAGGEPGNIIPGDPQGPSNSQTPFRKRETVRLSSRTMTVAQQEFRKQQIELQKSQAPAAPTCDTATETSRSLQYSDVVDPLPQPEMKMIIRKTLELIVDMSKSVELVYHGIRAVAKFLTYPTPSIPSANYVCGHLKGWIWLVFKCLSNFEPTTKDEVKVLNQEMSKLFCQARQLNKAFKRFNSGLKTLFESVKKEAKQLKNQNHLWALRIEGFFKFSEDLKQRKNLLVDTREDKSFPTDWMFDPNPSKTSEVSVPGKTARDSFHFQWIRTKEGWDRDGFEIRSDYSTRWHSFSEYSNEQKIELMVAVIGHATALLDECYNFVGINMKLNFDLEEIKCLQFAIAEILAVKKNTGTVEYIADLTKKLFQDMALLQEVSQEFADQLSWIANMIEPCYRTLGKKRATQQSETNTKNDFPRGISLPPLEISVEKVDEYNSSSLLSTATKVKNTFSSCSCFGKSHKDFLQLYGEPMEAVFLRTPISTDMIQRFFPKEYLIPTDEKFHIPIPAKINDYGLSEAYKSSIFDKAIGRDPPVKKVQKLPKFRRKVDLSNGKGKEKFDINALVLHSKEVIRKSTDGEIDTENYLRLFDQIKKFLLTFGTMFNFILSELTEKLENLDNKLYTGLTDYYESLEKIIGHEITAGIIQTDPWLCGTRAFRRINIALIFFTSFISEVINLNDTEGTYYVCKMCYYKTYSRYHSWITQKTSAFSIYSLPTKKALYNKICPTLQVTEVDKLFREFMVNAEEIYEKCESTFNAYQLHNL